MKTKNILLGALLAATFAHAPNVTSEQIDIFRTKATQMYTACFAGQPAQLSILSTIFNGGLAVLEANKNAENASQALDRLKALLNNIINTSGNKEATITMSIGHMQEQKIAELPTPYSYSLDKANKEDKITLIHELYNSWLRRAMINLDDSSVTVTRNNDGKVKIESAALTKVHKFNDINGEENTEEERRIIEEIANEVGFPILATKNEPNNVQFPSTHEQIVKSFGRVSGNDIRAEFLRSIFATYMATKEKTKESREQKQEYILTTLKYTTLFVFLVAGVMIGVGLAFWVGNEHYNISNRAANAENKFDQLDNTVNSKLDPALAVLHHMGALTNSFNVTAVEQFKNAINTGAPVNFLNVELLTYIGKIMYRLNNANAFNVNASTELLALFDYL